MAAPGGLRLADEIGRLQTGLTALEDNVSNLEGSVNDCIQQNEKSKAFYVTILKCCALFAAFLLCVAIFKRVYSPQPSSHLVHLVLSKMPSR